MHHHNLNNLIIIDDDPLDFDFYLAILKKLFPDLIIERREEIDENFTVSFPPGETLILLDLNLSGEFGLDLYREKLRDNNYFTIVHSSSDNPSDIAKCKAAGITGYFSKKSNRREVEFQLELIVNYFKLNLIKTVENPKN